jgi:hypothetical protein
MPCSKERELAAYESYIDTEFKLKHHVLDQSNYRETFLQVSDLIWGNMFSRFDHLALLPKHGPGSTVERFLPNRKFSSPLWYSRLNPYFPVDHHMHVNLNAFVDRLEDYIEIPVEMEGAVEVISVPKTLKTPRIIAKEPCCMQYAQQSICRYLVETIEGSELTAGHVNFSDQSINQDLAIKASIDGEDATIDLTAASDNVPLSDVKLMLRSTPDLLGALLASRSEHAHLLGARWALSKFASMGSAVCFPIEAMFFLYYHCIGNIGKTTTPNLLRLH